MISNFKSWMIVAAVCIGVTISIFLSILPSLSYGSEILKSTLCVNDISIEKAAELTGYTGCMDSAYQISHIVCIVDGDTTRCVSIDNKKRRSKGGGTHHGVAILDDGLDDDGWPDTVERQPELTPEEKALDRSPQAFYNQIIAECNNGIEVAQMSVKERDDSDRCIGANYYDLGYFNDAIKYHTWVNVITQGDIKIAETAFGHINTLVPYPASDQKETIGFIIERIERAKERLGLQGAK